MIFANVLEKNKESLVIIYSRQTQRPVGAGVIVNGNGTFITVTDIVTDIEATRMMYARLYNSDQEIPFQVVTALPQERISIC